MLVTSDVGWRKRHEAPDLPLPKAATTRNIQAHNLPDSIPAHVKEALTKCSIPDAFMHNYDEEHDVHHYIIVEIKYCRDTDPLPQQSRASQQHHVLRETLAQHAPKAVVEQVTLTLGVSGVLYNASIKALKDKLGVTEPQLGNLLTQLHHIAVDNLNRIWAQRWAMINQLTARGDAKPKHATHPLTASNTNKKRSRPPARQSTKPSLNRLLPKRAKDDSPPNTPCRILGPTGMVGGVKTSCHTRPPSLNYAGSTVPPSVVTHSLTHSAPLHVISAPQPYYLCGVHPSFGFELSDAGTLGMFECT